MSSGYCWFLPLYALPGSLLAFDDHWAGICSLFHGVWHVLDTSYSFGTKRDPFRILPSVCVQQCWYMHSPPCWFDFLLPTPNDWISTQACTYACRFCVRGKYNPKSCRCWSVTDPWLSRSFSQYSIHPPYQELQCKSWVLFLSIPPVSDQPVVIFHAIWHIYWHSYHGLYCKCAGFINISVKPIVFPARSSQSIDCY